MYDDYQYPKARDTKEYCLKHNLKRADYYGECPVCTNQVALLVTEDIPFQQPHQFRELMVFYDNLAYFCFLSILLFPGYVLSAPSLLVVMPLIGFALHRLATGSVTLNGLGYRFLGIITGVFWVITMFTLMITPDLFLLVPFTIAMMLSVFSYRVYSDKMVTGLMNLPDALKFQFEDRSYWVINRQTIREKIIYYLKRLILTFIVALLTFQVLLSP